MGFAHNAILSHADAVIGAIKSGAIKNFFVIGGCDGSEGERRCVRGGVHCVVVAVLAGTCWLPVATPLATQLTPASCVASAFVVAPTTHLLLLLLCRACSYFSEVANAVPKDGVMLALGERCFRHVMLRGSFAFRVRSAAL